MNKTRLLLILVFLISCHELFPQVFLITEPKMEFDGYKLSIKYDLVNKDQSDDFFIKVEIRNKEGVPLKARSFKGDVGDRIKPGNNKVIIWVPQEDTIYIDEDVTVELLGEKYEKLFNKGSALALSAILPGLGQTKISKGKPWWLLGVAAYGSLAGGLVVHKNYLDTYNAYKIEEDPMVRQDLFDKSQTQLNLSNALFISAATIWVTNIVWVALIPNKKPLQLVRLSANPLPGNKNWATVLSIRVDF